MVALGFVSSRIMGAFSFSIGLDRGFFVWIPVVIVLALLVGWYTIHLLLALSQHRAHKPLPTPTESLNRIPQLILSGILTLIVVGGPFAVLALVALLFSVGAGAQETAALALMDASSSEGVTAARLGNVLFGGVGIIAVLAGGFWAIYSSLRLSQVTPLVVVSQMKAIDAMKQSWAITKGQLWYIFGWSLLLGLFSFLLGIPAGIIDSALGFFSLTLGLLALASNALSAFLMMPWASLFTLEIFERVKASASKTPATESRA